MTLFRNAVFTAALAGLLAGIILAAMQTFATVPLIPLAGARPWRLPCRRCNSRYNSRAGRSRRART